MTGIGFAYAAAAAVGNSCIDGSRKLASQRFTATELIGLVGLLDAIFLVVAVFGSGMFSSVNDIFKDSDLNLLKIVVVSAGIKVIAGFLYQRALHMSPLSVTIPYLAFTPVLLVFTSFILMREMPSSQGLLGVVVVTLGGYLLAIEQPGEAEIKRERPRPKLWSSFLASAVTMVSGRLSVIFRGKERSFQSVELGKWEDNRGVQNGNLCASEANEETRAGPLTAAVFKGVRCPSLDWISLGTVFEPVLALRREPGSLLMVGVAGLLSVSNSLDKMGAHLAPSPIVFAAIQKVIMAIPVVVFLGLTSPASFRLLFGQFPALVAISLFEIVAFICYLKSLETLLVAYSIAAKRSNVLISVIIGRLIFKEKILRRLPFIILMMGGMTLIVLA